MLGLAEKRLQGAMIAATLAAASVAHAFAPLALGPPRVERTAQALRATAVAVADERIEGWNARCSAAQRDATRVATGALHGYVDGVLRDALASPAATAAAHDAVDAGAERTASRTLVDCASSVEVTLPLARLREATSAWSIAW